MKIRLNLRSFLPLFIAFLFVLPAQSFGQRTNQEILDIVIKEEFKNTTLMYVLDSTRQTYKIPIIFEVADSGLIRETLVDLNTEDININAGKFSDVLDSIIKQKPNYKWEIVDGVVNFTPIKNRNPFIEKLFNSQINTFSVESFTFFSEIDQKLEEIPEVAELLKLNEIKVNNIYDYAGFRGATHPKYEVNLAWSNVTFKKIVNDLAKKTPNDFWFIYLSTIEIKGKTKQILYL